MAAAIGTIKIPLAPWRPDQANIGGEGGLLDVRNVIPARGHWRPQRGLGDVATQDVPSPVQGLFTASRTTGDGELFIVAAGHIYRLPSRSGDLVDASRGSFYNAGADVRWRFVQFGTGIVATDFLDPPQYYDLIDGGTFDDLAGSPPKAKYLAVVRDFPVLAYTSDNIDGEDPYQVRWPGYTNGLPDPTNWTRSASTQADSQRMDDVGPINGLTGGEFGAIVGESGVRRMFYGRLLFDFDTVERRLGTRIPNSVVQYRQLTFFWAPEGICAFDGQQVRQIGVEKVDRFIADDHDEAFKTKMWSTVEIGRGHVLWAYCGAGHTGQPNRLLRYSVPLDEFALSDITLDALGPGKTFAMSLDDDAFDDLDAFEGNLDDPALWDTLPQTVAVANGRIQGFLGAKLEARFTTPEFQAGGDEARAIARRALVGQEGGVATVQVFAREAFDRPGVWSAQFARQSDGFHRFRVPGRSHALRVAVSGDWRTASEVRLTAEPFGLR